MKTVIRYFVLVSLFLVFSSLSFAQFRPEGVIKVIALKNERLRVAIKIRGGQEALGHWYYVNKKTEVIISGKRAKVQDLKVGDLVTIVFHGEVAGNGAHSVLDKIVKKE